MRWIEVEEHLPSDEELYLTYASVFGNYQLAKWTPSRGWLDEHDSDIRVITHWMDMKLNLPYPILDSADEELAKKYKLKAQRSIFG